jgi:type VI secretion system secreted protein Hcp
MAVDMFIKIGAIAGESKDSVHKGEIDVLAWSWGMSNSGSTHMGTGGGSGKVNVQDLSFTKYVDSSSPALQLACMVGTHYDKATLTVRKAGGTPIEYIVIEMDELLISSVSTGGSGGEDRLTENVSLNFAKVTYTYTAQLDGGGKGASTPYTYDIAANQEGG